KKFTKPGVTLSRTLSLIDECSVEKQTIGSVSETATKSIQTDLESVYGYKTQYSQTDRDLFPDEELELLVQENAIFVQNYTSDPNNSDFVDMCPSPQMAPLTPFFFDFNLKIRTKYQNPITFRVQNEIKIGAHEPMRYKYKLYPNDEVENSSLNHYVFCQLKEDRLVGSFICVPPIEGRYYLKIYAKPERFMADKQNDSSSLHSAVTFLLECTRARKYIEPFPLNELPWGPTQAFYDYKMKLHNQIGPIISTWGGKRRLCLESNEPMLITYQVMDSDGMEMDAKNLILRDDVDNKINFTISFPRVGMFKFMIFGMPKPKQKGKWRLPLLATFLIDCKLAKVVTPDDDPPPERVSNTDLSEHNTKIKRK
ncbi:uncharacterized protein B4U80_11008, partial [Leptotrombidium deliense]